MEKTSCGISSIVKTSYAEMQYYFFRILTMLYAEYLLFLN